LSAPRVEVVLSDDALERLPAHVEGPVVVVMDANTRLAAGVRVLAALEAARVDAEPVVFERRSGLAATPEAVQRVHERLTGGRLAVAVGSGVITDVVRRAADLAGVAFISVPTAASMDGYASSVAALQIDGVKVTVPARPPRAVFADPRVAARAPLELTRAGIGDMLAKATARVDWLAAHLLYGESFEPDVDRRVLALLGSVVERAQGALGGEPAAVAALLRGLIESGLAIAAVGSSRPASGCEHHASHFWDLLAARGVRPHHPHGLQVGYATWFAMRLQRFAFDGGLAELRPPQPPTNPLDADARRWLGRPSKAIREAVADKRRFVSRLDHWPRDQAAWQAVRDAIRPSLARFASVERALAAAGIPREPGFLGLDRAMLRATFRHATRLRSRYTVIDLLEGQGVLEQAIDAALAPG